MWFKSGLTRNVSQRRGVRAVALLRVHLPGVGAAPPRSCHGTPGPRQRAERTEDHQQRLHLQAARVVEADRRAQLRYK